MKGTLIIFILSITSSYSDNIELPADEYFDVIEFWITDSSAYRIKTFSIDLDIHVHSLKVDNQKEGIKVAEQTTPNSYGDIIKKEIKIELNGNETDKQLKEILKDNGLCGDFEIKDFVFWNPDLREYRTKTNPEKN